MKEHKPAPKTTQTLPYKPRIQKFRKFRVFYTYPLYIYFNIIQMVRRKIRGGYIYFFMELLELLTFIYLEPA